VDALCQPVSTHYVTKADVIALRIEMRIYGALTLAIAAKLFGVIDAVAAIL